MIFKNNGDIIRKNDEAGRYWNGKNIFQKSGGILFGSDGSRAVDNGNFVYKNKKTIVVNGNYLFTSDGRRYVLNEGILFGPRGEQWRGVNSIEEAKDIVSMQL